MCDERLVKREVSFNEIENTNRRDGEGLLISVSVGPRQVLGWIETQL